MSLLCSFFFSSRRRHTRLQGDWSSDVCSSDLFATLNWGISHNVLPICLGNPLLHKDYFLKPSEDTPKAEKNRRGAGGPSGARAERSDCGFQSEHVRAARRQDPRRVFFTSAWASRWGWSGSHAQPEASPPTHSQLGAHVARRVHRRAVRSVRKGQNLWHLRCWRPRQNPSWRWEAWIWAWPEVYEASCSASALTAVAEAYINPSRELTRFVKAAERIGGWRRAGARAEQKSLQPSLRGCDGERL